MRTAAFVAALALAGCAVAHPPVVATKIVRVMPHIPPALLVVPPPVPLPKLPATNAEAGDYIVNLRINDRGLRDQIGALRTILIPHKGTKS